MHKGKQKWERETERPGRREERRGEWERRGRGVKEHLCLPYSFWCPVPDPWSWATQFISWLGFQEVSQSLVWRDFYSLKSSRFRLNPSSCKDPPLPTVTTLAVPSLGSRLLQARGFFSVSLDSQHPAQSSLSICCAAYDCWWREWIIPKHFQSPVKIPFLCMAFRVYKACSSPGF